jgi:hypothetical protein
VLKSIRLKNFKLHEDTSIEAAPITVFIGPNNTGKSSIFQALLLPQAAARNESFSCQPAASYQPPPSEPYQYSPQLTLGVGKFEEIARRGGDDIHVEFSGAVHTREPIYGIEQASVSAQLRVRENQLLFHFGSVDVFGSKASWGFVRGGRIENGALSPRLRGEGLGVRGPISGGVVPGY